MKISKWMLAAGLTSVMALAACTDDSDVEDELEPDDTVEEVEDIDPADEGAVDPEEGAEEDADADAEEVEEDVEEDAE